MKQQDSEGDVMAASDDGMMIIDCDRCEVRPHACSDCVVSVLLGTPRQLEWGEAERRAVDALADGGIVPRLRLVSTARNLNTQSHREAG